MRDLILNDLFFRLVSTRTLDFVALNYYTRCSVRSCGGPLTRVVGRACKEKHHVAQGRDSDLGWEIYPQGLTAALAKWGALGLPVFVTENGVATEDDGVRCDFLRDHLEAVGAAIGRGVNVIGYLHWSLIDNFEWDHGTQPRFGLVAVDYPSQGREPRASAALFSELCQGRRRPGRVAHG